MLSTTTTKEKDTKKDKKISPKAVEFLEICRDLSEKILFPTASHGNGKNRKNEFDPDLDEAIFEMGRRKLLSVIKDDAE